MSWFREKDGLKNCESLQILTKVDSLSPGLFFTAVVSILRRHIVGYHWLPHRDPTVSTFVLVSSSGRFM